MGANTSPILAIPNAIAAANSETNCIDILIYFLLSFFFPLAARFVILGSITVPNAVIMPDVKLLIFSAFS